jgi:thiamine-phosphate diphosphorylase
MVNDRVDVAVAANAGGVHLREHSISVEAAATIRSEGFRIGRSVHSREAAKAAHRANYLIAGTVLATAAKASAPLLGWGGLAAVVEAAGDLPVFAIGGLTRESVPDLVASGARGLAAIGAFIPEQGVDLAPFVQKTVGELRFAFDSTHRLS